MSSNWPTVKLGDFCKKIGSGATPRGGASVYMDDGEICLIRSQNVHNEGFNPNGLVYIDEDAAKKLSNVIVEENDVLLNITGDSVARVCLAKSRFLPARVNQHVAIIRPDEDEFDPRFIRYLLASPTYQNILLSIAAVGATRNALTKGMIENLDVLKPPIEQQIEMANQLEALDKKIDINSETNQTLEQIAQAIFKSWFVDFDPVKAKIEALAAGGSADDAELAAMSVISAKTLDELNSLKVSNPEAFNKLAQTAALFPSAMQDSELGEIPKGWEVGKLANIIDFNPRRTLKKGTLAPYLDMKNVPTTGHLAIEVVDREMASGTKFVNGDTLLARITPCLENGKTAYVDFLKDNQVGWGSTEYIVMRPKEGYPTSIGYLLARDTNFRQQAIQSMTGTSGRQRADAKALAETAWLIYPKELVRAFDKTAKGYLSLAKINGDESKSLSEIRDALLPKLLSGELVGE
ncbi:restriction endonuclease subunit S [Vibrio vulnificus]